MDPMTLFYIATAVIAGGSAYSAAQKAKKAEKAAKGSTLNKNSNIEPIPVLYGKRRIGGTRVYLSSRNVSGGDKNEFLYIALVLCEGEVQSIENIEIDGNPITGMNTPGDRFYNLLTIEKYYGTDSQTASTILKESSPAWTNDHRLQGVAYIAIRLKYYYKSFSGVPEITAYVEGRKLYDPRTGLTAYSTNPALCIRDYLTNVRYGKGLGSGFIDDATFQSAANDCDAATFFYAGAPYGKIFESNALIDTDQEIFANLQTLLQGCRGFLPYSQGKYGLVIDKSASSVFAFDTDTIVGGIQIKGESKADKFNRVICKFINPAANWQEDTAIYPAAGSAEETAFLAEDGGTLLQGEFSLDTITSYYAALDFARIFLRRSRNAMRVSFNCTSEALQLSVADVVTVTHPTPGFAAKPFQVEEITLNYDGTCGVSLLEYDSTIYTYDLASEQTAYPDTVLPDPFTVAAPTDLTVTETTYVSSDGSVIPEIEISWTPSEDSFVIEYELQYRLTPEEGVEADYFSIITRESQVASAGAIIGSAYEIQVRAINSIGSISDFVTTTYTPTGDVTAPAKPAGLAVIGDYKEAVLTWDAAEEKDYKETILYSSTTNDFDTATERARVSGTTITYYGLSLSTTYYIWIKHVDYTGNISVVSDVYTFTTTAGVQGSQIAPLPINVTKLAAATIGLSSLIDPKLFITLNPDRATADLRITASYDQAVGAPPDRMIVFYSAADAPNGFTVGVDTGTKLYIDTSGTSGAFSLPVAAGSTLSRVRYTNTEDVDIDLSGSWWMLIDSPINGETPQYYKISESSATELHMQKNEELPFLPQVGDAIHIVETDYADGRLPQFKLAFVNGEVIRHGGIKFDGLYYLDCLERGAEGTTQANQGGKTAHYFPALGPLTDSLEIMSADFTLEDDQYSYAGTLPINIPANFVWSSVSCCLARRASEYASTQYVRSHIVDLTVAGPA